MKLKFLVIGGCASAALLFTAVPQAPAAVRECIAGSPTAASYSWDFHQEANNLFRDVQTDARQIVDRTAYLQRENGDAGLTWISHSDKLNQVKDEVNDMSAKLCRLAAIRRVLTPWQQQTVDRIAAKIPLMVDAADDAISVGNKDQHTLWMPAYQKYINDLYDDATALNQSVGEAVQYATVSRHYHELRNDLGLKASS